MRLLEKITECALVEMRMINSDVYNADDTFIANNCWMLHANLIVSRMLRFDGVRRKYYN